MARQSKSMSYRFTNHESTPKTSEFDKLVNRIHDVSDLDQREIAWILQKILNTSNETVEHQLKNLLMVSKLTWAEELADHKRQIREFEDAQRRKMEAQKAAIELKYSEAKKLSDANGKQVQDNIAAMNVHVKEFLKDFRNESGRLVDALTQKDRDLLEIIMSWSNGKLTQERCGFLWTRVRVRGKIDRVILFDDILYKYLIRCGIGKKIEPIPSHLLTSHSGGYFGHREDPKYFIMGRHDVI